MLESCSTMEKNQNSGKSRDGKKRRRSKGRGRYNRGKQKQASRPAVLCSMCSRPIEFPASAITGFNAGQIAHLQCVIKELESKETLKPGQRIVYIGQGTFAVVAQRQQAKQGVFDIIKRISHENSEQKKLFKAVIEGTAPPAESRTSEEGSS